MFVILTYGVQIKEGKKFYCARIAKNVISNDVKESSLARNY